MANDGDYKVGYKKPPKHSQFKKGESGRDRARSSSRVPRVKQTLHDVIRTVAGRLTKVREGDTVREVRLAELVVEKAINDAIRSSNSRHLQYVLKLLQDADAFGDREMTDEENVADFLATASRETLQEIEALKADFAKYLPEGENGHEPEED